MPPALRDDAKTWRSRRTIATAAIVDDRDNHEDMNMRKWLPLLILALATLAACSTFTPRRGFNRVLSHRNVELPAQRAGRRSAAGRPRPHRHRRVQRRT